jgi:hypothetical protein
MVIKYRRMRWAGLVARVGDRKGTYRVLVGKPEGKRQLVKPRHMWEGNTEINLVEVGWRGEAWTGLLWRAGNCECGDVLSFR